MFSPHWEKLSCCVYEFMSLGMTRIINLLGKKKEKRTRPVIALCQLRTESIRSIPDASCMILFVLETIKDGLGWSVYL